MSLRSAMGYNRIMKLSISVFGRDEPGVIAILTSSLKDAGANIEDASMTLLQGFFAMIMVIDIEDTRVASLASELKHKDELVGFVVNIAEAKDEPKHTKVDTSLEGKTRYVLKMGVHDSVGIVAQVTKILSDNNANIVDFRTVRDNDTNLFSLFLDVDVLNSCEEIVSFEIKNLANTYAGYIDFNTVEEVDL